MKLITHSDQFAGPLGELRAASTAAGGSALTTTPVLIVLPNGSTHVALEARNFAAGAVAAQVTLNPYLRIVRTDDLLQTLTDYSDEAQDGSAATVVTLSALSTFALEGALYIGSHVPFRGVAITLTALNVNASVLSVYYWNGTAWTDITVTDGTIAPAGTTLGQSGNATWTVPTAWARGRLCDICAAAPLFSLPQVREVLYWTRWQVSAAIDAATTAPSMLALNRSTAYAELISGGTLSSRVHKGIEGHACIEARTDGGTANLIVNVSTDAGALFR